MIIIGCSALGAHLATRLDHLGCAIRLLDREGAAFASLPERLTIAALAGEPLSLDLLRRAGIAGARVLVAVTHEDDLNAAAALTALRLFGTGLALALIGDPERCASYRRLGITTVCSTPAVVAAFLHRVESLATR